MSLSVAMIVKNESSCLAKCLESVKEADEIVVCDTGSEDNTVEIARKYTNKVFTEYRWEDSFAKARNYALSKCTGDWILTIDADETLLPGGMAAIKNAIKDTDETIFSLKIKARSYGDVHLFPRVHRRIPEIFWKGDIHNYMSVSAQKTIDATIEYGYSEAHKKDPDRSLRILKKVVEADPSLIREKYYLAREYWCRRDFSTALERYNDYLRVANWAPEKADGYLMKARCLWHLNRGEEARDACLQALKINAGFKEAILFMSEMSGPKNRERWITFAEFANNEDVLFIRNRLAEGAAYYQSLEFNDERYKEIRKMVQDVVGWETKVLDIGCGPTQPLREYFTNYRGFDFAFHPSQDVANPENYRGNFGAYLCCEVLEHLENDLVVIDNLPSGAFFVFTVPSFFCRGHVRVFSKDSIHVRYGKKLDIKGIERFNWHARWTQSGNDTADCIYLCAAFKK